MCFALVLASCGGEQGDTAGADSESADGGAAPAAVSGDLNQDGFGDVVLLHDDVVYTQLSDNSSLATTREADLVTDTVDGQVMLPDIDGDGRLERVVVRSRLDEQATISIYPDAFSSQPVVTPLEQLPNNEVLQVGFGDFNGDDRDDLLVFSMPRGGVVLYPGAADGTLASPEAWGELPGRPDQGLASGDFDGDGTDDLLTNSYDTDAEVQLLVGTGTGFTETGPSLDPFVNYTPIELDGDDQDEVFAGDRVIEWDGSDWVETWDGSDLGYMLGGAQTGVSDIDGDGIEDLLALSSEGDVIRYLYGGDDGLEPSLDLALGDVCADYCVLASGVQPGGARG